MKMIECGFGVVIVCGECVFDVYDWCVCVFVKVFDGVEFIGVCGGCECVVKWDECVYGMCDWVCGEVKDLNVIILLY